MYHSRTKDLERLQAVIDNPDETPLHKRQAGLAIQRILWQLRDRTLHELRERLVRAQAASDVEESDKISRIIQEHMYRQYGNMTT